MLVPRLVSIEALGYALHECGHFHLRHFRPDETDNLDLRNAYTGNVKATVAEQEFECEKWTQGILHLHGLPVTRTLRQDMRQYVAALIDDDTAKAKTPSHIKKWSQR